MVVAFPAWEGPKGTSDVRAQIVAATQEEELQNDRTDIIIPQSRFCSLVGRDEAGMTLRRSRSSVFGGQLHRPDEPKRCKHRDQRTLHIKSGAGIVSREKDDEMVRREA